MKISDTKLPSMIAIFILKMSARTCCVYMFATFLTSCEELVQLKPPKTALVSETTFANDATASAAVSGIYFQMLNGSFISGGAQSITFLTGLSSDESISFSASQDTQQFYENSILSTNDIVSKIWGEGFNFVYQANAVLEGVTNSRHLTPPVKAQLQGEAKFIRAFVHFYMVNLFGDIPYIKSTDYRINTVVSRLSAEEVYRFIIEDLLDAKELLKEDYSYSNGERTRPNRWAATALLSRTYLYLNEWAKAELEATNILAKTSIYNLTNDLDAVFLKNSTESIWQLKPITGGGINTREGNIFILKGMPTFSALQNTFVSGFEAGDERIKRWVGSFVVGGKTFYFPNKYKIKTGDNPINEYSMVFRLSEQYLIRAESKAHQDKFYEAINDLNVIRQRAKLPLISNDQSISQDNLLLKIEQERKIELFSEWGHRWFDLKRTSRANTVLAPVKLNWTPSDVLMPIPESEILINSNLRPQNPGY